MKNRKLFKTLFLLPLFLLTSCTNDEEKTTIAENIIENETDININGIDYKSTNKNVDGNENCDMLFFSASYNDESKIKFNINFQLSKEGELLKVWYGEYDPKLLTPQIMKIFLTPNFRPKSTFNISNFSRNYETGEVKFDFEGTLFLESNNNVTRNIDGKIKFTSLESINCTTTKTGLSYDSQNFKLLSFYNNSVKFEDEKQYHNFFLNNGYLITLSLSKDLWNNELTEIPFTETDLIDRADFRKAIGPIIANQNLNIDQQEWENYQTSGKIILLNKSTEKYGKVITGKLNLIVKNNNQIIYELNGIDFKTGSFEN